MSTAHRQRIEFYNALSSHVTEHGCDHGTRATTHVLKAMGLAQDEIDASLASLAKEGGFCDCEILMNLATSKESAANPQEPEYLRLNDIDLLSPQSLEIAQAAESGYRRGVSQALSFAGDLVRGGATADDLDQLTDLSMDWRYDRESHLAYLDELVQAWRQGARGVTGVDLRSLVEQQT